MYPESIRPPVLSICVPTFNRARYLDCLLQDLADNIGDLGFTYEVLIGDNASEDDTPTVISSFAGRLNIRYFRRSENLGARVNLAQLMHAADGRYLLVLADDDLVLMRALGTCLEYLEAHPEVGAVFAPWFIHDRVIGVDFDQFYAVANETSILAGDHRALFNFLVNGHIFPEIYIAKTSLIREIVVEANQFAYIFFSQIAAMVDRTAITFLPDPFYRQVIRYFEAESRGQHGHEEVKTGWDCYRGGLEYILSRFASLLSADDLGWCHRAIDYFARVRMGVGLRVRTDEGKNWIDNYYIANRLRCAGNDTLLPAPYETYRINAAFEHLVGLQPFYPTRAAVAYYADDAPLILAQARAFATTDFVVLDDRSQPLPDNTILLTSREPMPSERAAFVISESELLAKFP